jgi:hypothetical protein
MFAPTTPRIATLDAAAIETLLDGLDAALLSGRRGHQTPVTVIVVESNVAHGEGLCSCMTSIDDRVSSLDAVIETAGDVMRSRSRQRVQLLGLPEEFTCASAVKLMSELSGEVTGNDCFANAARLALSLYGSTPAPRQTRFTLALLAIQWFASEHSWTRNNRFPEYPATMAWFRLFNTEEKLAEHLRESYAGRFAGRIRE